MLTLVSRFRRIKLSAAAKTIGGLALVLFGGLGLFTAVSGQIDGLGQTSIMILVIGGLLMGDGLSGG